MRRFLVDLEEVRKHWALHLGLGIILLLLGIVACAHALAASLISVLIFGWLLVGSGIAQAILAFRLQIWGGFFLHLLGGILEIVVGLLVIGAPLATSLAISLLLAVYLLVGGLFRTIAALYIGFPGAGWAALGGLISFLLGLALWKQMPLSGLLFIGVCVGIDLFLHGAAWIAFALTVRRAPDLEPVHARG